MFTGRLFNRHKFRSQIVPFFIALLAPLTLAHPTLSIAADRSPVGVTVLNKEDFLGKPVFSVADAIEGLASVDLVRDGYVGTKTTVSIRGVRGEGVAVLLDGIPINHEFDGAVDLSQIPINIVERIEVARGGGSLTYTGSAVGGTINIVTARPEHNGLAVRLGTSVGRDGVKNFDGRFLGRSNLGDLTYIGGRTTSGGFSKNEDVSATHHFGNVSRSFKGKGFWGAEYFFQNSKVGLPTGTPASFDAWNGHVEQIPNTEYPLRAQESQHVKFILVGPPSPAGRLSATFTGRLRTSDIRDFPGGPSLEDSRRENSTFDAKWRREHLEVGAQVRDLSREIWPTPSKNTHENAAYVAQEWSSARWTLAPSIRYQNPSKSDDALNPRVVAMFAPAEPWVFSMSATRAHRTPTYDEYFSTANVASAYPLKAESSDSYEIGGRWNPDDGDEIGVAGFFIGIDDVIVQNTGAPAANRGRDEIAGMDAWWRSLTGPAGKTLSLETNWTYQRGIHSEGGAPFVPRRLTPRHRVNVAMVKHLSLNYSLTNILRYQSEQYELDNRRGLRLPGYYSWDIRINVKIHEALFYAQCSNVTNRRYADAIVSYTPPGGSLIESLSPQAGRAFFGGVTIKFLN